MVKTFSMNGKKFIVKKIVHKNGDDDFRLIPYDEKEYDKTVGDVASKLAKAVNKKKMLKEVLARMDYDMIMSLKKELDKGVKPKARKGCYQIEVGNQTVDIVG